MRNPLRALFDRRMDSHGLWEALAVGLKAVTGKTVSESDAMRISTVVTCVSIRSRVVASLPLGVYERVDEKTRRPAGDHWLSSLLRRPNAWQTRYTFGQVMQVYLLLHRNAYAWVNWVKDPLNGGMRAVEMIPLHPSRVHVEQPNELEAPTYELRSKSGRSTPIPMEEMVHLRDLSTDGVTGRSLLADARDPIGLAQVQQEHAGTFWGRGGRPDVFLEHPKELSDRAKTALETSWAKTYGGGADQRRVAVLEEGMKASFPNVTHEASQFLETKNSTRSEIAGMFHVPSFLAGLEEKQTSWGTGVEQMVIGFSKFAVQPDCENWEEEYGRTLLRYERKQMFVKHRLEGLMRGDSKSWGEFVKTLREIGVLNANEVRALMDLNPREGGDAYGDLAYVSGKPDPAAEPKPAAS